MEQIQLVVKAGLELGISGFKVRHPDNLDTLAPINNITAVTTASWTLKKWFPSNRDIITSLVKPSYTWVVVQWSLCFLPSRISRVLLKAGPRPATAQRPGPDPQPSPDFPAFLSSVKSTHMHRSASGFGVQHGRRWVWIRSPFNHLNRLTMHFVSIGFCQRTNEQRMTMFFT